MVPLHIDPTADAIRWDFVGEDDPQKLNTNRVVLFVRITSGKLLVNQPELKIVTAIAVKRAKEKTLTMTVIITIMIIKITKTITITIDATVTITWDDRWTIAKLHPLRSHMCRTCTLAHHLSLGSSMVEASHRLSEGCGFDSPVWGWEIVFLRIELDDHSSIISGCFQALTLLKI